MASRFKAIALNLLLVGVAVVGPFVAYAGVTAIFPGSNHTINVATPPITFAPRKDFNTATTAGFVTASTFNGTDDDNGASFTVTLAGLSGGTVTADNFINVTVDQTKVSSYRLEVSTSWSAGTLSPAPTTIKYRMWGANGCSAPTDDTISACMSGPLNLMAAAGNMTGKANEDRILQLVMVFPNDMTGGSGTVSIRPRDIVFI